MKIALFMDDDDDKKQEFRTIEEIEWRAKLSNWTVRHLIKKGRLKAEKTVHRDLRRPRFKDGQFWRWN